MLIKREVSQEQSEMSQKLRAKSQSLFQKIIIFAEENVFVD